MHPADSPSSTQGPWQAGGIPEPALVFSGAELCSLTEELLGLLTLAEVVCAAGYLQVRAALSKYGNPEISK